MKILLTFVSSCLMACASKTLERANVRVIAINEGIAIIHLRLKAELVPVFRFDIDERFELKVTDTLQR